MPGRVILLAVLLPAAVTARPPEAGLRAEAARALKRAAELYRGKAASHGGYVYYYTPDFSERWGEGKANADTLFVEPPGTPTVGMAFLKAYAATGDRLYLDAARDAAGALVYGQLQSGGWTQTIHFGPAKRLGKYRNGKGGGWNVSSLDDGQTQAALQLLVLTDKALGLKDEKIHEAAGYGLKALLAAQYANGGFPQGWRGPSEEKPVVKASVPKFDWRTEGKIKDYYTCYTLNDDLAVSVADALIVAHRAYKDDKHLKALEKLGAFLALAQMPEPQPAWCQQYNFDMVPIWARKFEPPAIAGRESQGAMETLIKIARYTGDKKYLEPIPAALKYLKGKCMLPGDQLARYYEFGTNKPVYMDAKYRPTYDDSAAPRHYGWKHPSRLAEIEKAYEDAKKGTVPPARVPREAEVRRIIKDLDAEGRWVSVYGGERLVGQPKFAAGFKYVSSAVFSQNVETLSAYIAAGR